MVNNSRATLSKAQGRKSWCVIFRHPVRKDSKGQPVRVRRGLGTSDKSEAQALVDQLNELLDSPDLHTPESIVVAEQKYSTKIISAFYDKLTPSESPNFLALREDSLPLPPAGSECPRVLLLGQVGAGKTTVVRQLLGTNPEVERFPSTATARTTLCPMEFILGSAGFRGAVTFMPEENLRLQIEECLQDAARQVLKGNSKETIGKSLLEHPENVFKLSYVLGNVDLVNDSDADDSWDEDFDMFDGLEEEEEEPETLNREELREDLLYLITEITKITQSQAAHTKNRFGDELDLLDRRKRNELEEALEFDLVKNEKFQALIDHIVDLIRQRFDKIEVGEFKFKGDWPILWQWSCPNRTTFLNQIRQFSSNNARHFGSLLTPLVNGIRVEGEFGPGEWAKKSKRRFVIIDGMGLGHTSEGTHSLSTSISNQFDMVDVILIVDNAQQPMGHWPRTVFSSLVSSGHDYKIALSFTHFDLVEGDNMPSEKDKVRHLQLALKTAVRSLGSRPLENELQDYLKKRVVYLSETHRPAHPDSLAGKQLRKLLKVIEVVALQSLEGDAQPVYDGKHLRTRIAKAISEYHDLWLARLGIEPHSEANKEHWTRIKALTRRLGLLNEDEYNDLKPVADLAEILQEQLRDFLETPKSWRPSEADEAEKAQAKRRIAMALSRRIRKISKTRVLNTKLLEWQRAYHYTGKGSATKRAYELKTIYSFAAPQPLGNFIEQHEEFLEELYTQVAEAIREGGGIPRGTLIREDT